MSDDWQPIETALADVGLRVDPAEAILGLVCGLPEPLRSARPLFMLKAYADDSRSGAAFNRDAFVLGGYLSTAKTWAKFSDEWQAVLDRRPAIEYFKFSEAANFSGQFLYWSEERRRDRVSALYQVIEDNDLAQFSLCFRPSDLLKVYGEAWGEEHPHARNPYYTAHSTLIAGVLRSIRQLGFEIQPLEFIFDNQMREKGAVVSGWEWALENANPDPPELASIFKNPPSFADDKQVRPLQAGDFYASWIRALFERDISGQPRPPAFWTRTKELKGLSIIMTEQSFRDRLRMFRERFGPDATP